MAVVLQVNCRIFTETGSSSAIRIFMRRRRASCMFERKTHVFKFLFDAGDQILAARFELARSRQAAPSRSQVSRMRSAPKLLQLPLSVCAARSSCGRASLSVEAPRASASTRRGVLEEDVDQFREHALLAVDAPCPRKPAMDWDRCGRADRSASPGSAARNVRRTV